MNPALKLQLLKSYFLHLNTSFKNNLFWIFKRSEEWFKPLFRIGPWLSDSSPLQQMPQTIKETSYLFIIKKKKETLLYIIPVTLVSNLERYSIFFSFRFCQRW